MECHSKVNGKECYTVDGGSVMMMKDFHNSDGITKSVQVGQGI